jgi:hypothetical protein
VAGESSWPASARLDWGSVAAGLADCVLAGSVLAGVPGSVPVGGSTVGGAGEPAGTEAAADVLAPEVGATGQVHDAVAVESGVVVAPGAPELPEVPWVAVAVPEAPVSGAAVPEVPVSGLVAPAVPEPAVSGVAVLVPAGQGTEGAAAQVAPSACEAVPEAVGAVPESAGPGCTGLPDAGGRQSPGEVGRAGTPGPLAGPEEAGWPGGAVPLAPPAATPLPPAVVRAPDPSATPPPACGLPPSWNTVVLAWMIAWRTGCTPIETQAMTVTPASPPASHSNPARPPPSAARRGKGSPLLRASPEGAPLRCRGRLRRHGMCTRASGNLGQAQCPRQVQDLTRSAAPDRTESSQGRGGRLPMRARMLPSPSVPGSTPLTASDSARRSAPSGSSSGEDGFSSTCPPGHGAPCSRVDLRAAIARAV